MLSNNKIKVLVAIPSGFCFGLQHVSIDLFEASKEAIEPHFLVTKWSNGDFEKMLKTKGFNYSYSWFGMFSRKLDWVNLKMSVEAFIRLPSLYYTFLKLIKKQRPDVLFFANHHELILLLPVLWLTKRKVVCHMHDPAPAIPFQQKTFAWYGKRVDHFIAISDNVKQRLMLLGCADEKITVVHNGIELPKIMGGRERSDYFTKQFGWDEHVFIVGITGQMTATKGHEDLLEAFKIAITANPALRLVIGGKQMEPLYSQLLALIQENNLQEQVRFGGWQEEKGNFYNAIDVFVLASRHDEGYGLVVAEAMGHGKPAIITRSGGAIEIVSDQIDGFIVDKADIEALADRLVRISANTAMYRFMCGKAIEKIEKQFSMQIASYQFIQTLNGK